MSQAELARRVGYTDRSSIAKIEKGAVDLSQSKIKQFADVFGVSSGQLMGWEQEPEDLADITAQILLNPKALKHIQNYLQLSEAEQYALDLVMASMLNKEKKADASSVSQEVETVSLLKTE